MYLTGSQSDFDVEGVGVAIVWGGNPRVLS